MPFSNPECRFVISILMRKFDNSIYKKLFSETIIIRPLHIKRRVQSDGQYTRNLSISYRRYANRKYRS